MSVPVPYPWYGYYIKTLPNKWAVDGTPMPRNPDAYSMDWDKPNISYEAKADGTQTRIAALQLIRGGNLTISWEKADRRLLNYILRFLNPSWPQSNQHQLFFGGILPQMYANVFFDEPKKAMSKDAVSKILGSGGVRHDLTLVLRTDTYMRSLAPVPLVPTLAYINANFLGPAGNASDNIPAWDGNPWTLTMDPSKNGHSQGLKFSNLGTAPWSPIILMTGPFTSMKIGYPGVDVDGSGNGINWTWTGSPLNTGDYILFDTFRRRCYLYTIANTTLQEVYTFYIHTNSGANPIPYWPPFPPGETQLLFTANGIGTGTTVVDLTNNGTETFPYY